MKPFKDESDVRRWFKRKCPGVLLWVEAASGGSQGFPDCVSINQAEVVFVELKVGKMLDSGMAEFKMHNTQRITLRAIKQEGGLALVLIGEEGGTRLWVADPEDVFPRIGRDLDEGIRGRIPHIANVKEVDPDEPWA